MARSVIKSGRGSRGIGFIVIMAVVVYALTSVAVAVTTVKDCDPYGKHWAIVPPHWICESGQNISPN